MASVSPFYPAVPARAKSALALQEEGITGMVPHRPFSVFPPARLYHFEDPTPL